MALKPTIYKLEISISDLDRDYYNNVNLTLAKHPSETTERLMARVLAYCLSANDDLVFTKGLSEVEEPDLWSKSLDDQILLWIEVGEPDSERVKKASRKAEKVKVYSFNSKSDVWWKQSRQRFINMPVDVYRFDWNQIQSVAEQITRTMIISVTLAGNSIYLNSDELECEVNWSLLG